MSTVFQYMSGDIHISLLSPKLFSRVPGTLINLRFQLGEDILEEGELQQTLTRTQLDLRRFMIAYPPCVDLPLIGNDDPYISLPSDSNGAFFGVTHWPVMTPSRLTYTMVDNVLTGVIHVLCQERKYVFPESQSRDSEFVEYREPWVTCHTS